MLWIVEKGRPLRNVPGANLFRTISLTIDALGTEEETKKKKLLLHEEGFTTSNLAGQSCSLYIGTIEISAEYFATIKNYSPTFYCPEISMNYLREPCPMPAQQIQTSRSWHTRYRMNKIFWELINYRAITACVTLFVWRSIIIGHRLERLFRSNVSAQYSYVKYLREKWSPFIGRL